MQRERKIIEKKNQVNEEIVYLIFKIIMCLVIIIKSEYSSLFTANRM